MSGADASSLTTVIVVAADSGPILRKCITAVLASHANVEIVLVDNASRDGEPQRMLATHTDDARIRILENASNLGFGPACNCGAELANGDTFLFLNPDCMVEPETIAGLQVAAASLDGDSLLGVDVRDCDNRSARGNRRRDPFLRRVLMSAFGFARWQESWPGLAGIELPPVASPADIEPVDAVSGACLFLQRRLFERVGGFDEGYFLHFEDLDLCRRVRNIGASVAIVHSLHAVHVQGSSSHHRPLFVSWHKHRGMWRWFQKHDPASRNRVARASVWLGIWTHFALSAPLLWLRKMMHSA